MKRRDRALLVASGLICFVIYGARIKGKIRFYDVAQMAPMFAPVHVLVVDAAKEIESIFSAADRVKLLFRTDSLVFSKHPRPAIRIQSTGIHSFDVRTPLGVDRLASWNALPVYNCKYFESWSLSSVLEYYIYAEWMRLIQGHRARYWSQPSALVITKRFLGLFQRNISLSNRAFHCRCQPFVSSDNLVVLDTSVTHFPELQAAYEYDSTSQNNYSNVSPRCLFPRWSHRWHKIRWSVIGAVVPFIGCGLFIHN